jgi:hypothetical protein
LPQVRPYKVDHIIPQSDKRGYSYKPGFRDDRQGISINEFGFRVSPTGPDPAPGAEVIACLGDSVPFGHGLRDEETYPFQLDKLLKQAGSPLAAINAGVQSYNLQQSIEHLSRDVLGHYDPVAVTMQTANDVGLLLTYRWAWTPESTWAPYRPNIPFLLNSFATLHHVLPVVGGLVGRFVGGQAGGYPLDPMLENEERLLRELIGTCSAKTIQLVLMPINPFYYQTKATEKNAQLSRWPAWRSESAGADTVIEQFNQVLIRVARDYGPAQGVHVFDVRAYLDDQPRDGLYTDFIHHSPEGNQRVAQGLFEFLRAMNIAAR